MNSIIVCPMCHGRLAHLVCTRCGVTYDSRDGVPSFICPQMYPSDREYDDALRIMEFWGNGWKKRLDEPDHRPMFEYDREALAKHAERAITAHKASDSVMAVDLPLDTLPGRTALNIGCGAGSEALVLAHSGAECIAMDITSPAARAADLLIHRIGGKGVGIQADSRFLPLETSSIDVVYSSGVLHHSPNIARSVAELHRALKPGGTAYIMLYATWSVLFVQQRLLRSMGEREWETGNRKNPHTTTYTVEECRRLFSAFTNVRVRKTGENLKHLAKLGKYMPESLDRFLYPYLGPRLNIVAEKPNV